MTTSLTLHTHSLQPGGWILSPLSFGETEEKGEEEPAGLGGLSKVHTECTTAGDAAPFPP